MFQMFTSSTRNVETNNVVDISARIEICLNKYQRGDFRETLAGLNLILSTNASQIQPLKLRARTYLALGDLDNALIDTTSILNLYPNDTDALNFLSEIHLKQGRHGDALDVLNQLLRHEPDYLQALNRRANIDQQTFEKDHDQDELFFQRAIADCTALCRLEPHNADSICARSIFYKHLKMYDEALVDCETALLMGSNKTYAQHRRLLLTRIDIFLIQKKWDEALIDINSLVEKTAKYPADSSPSEIITFTKNYINALYYRVDINLQLNKLSDMLLDLNVILKLEPNDLDALIRRHCICKKQGNLRQTALDEYAIHALTLELGGHGVPSLSQFAKMAFYKHEPLIEGSGQIYRKDSIAVRWAFEINGINRRSLDAIQTKLNGGVPLQGKTVFDQLDAIDTALITAEQMKQLMSSRQMLPSSHVIPQAGSHGETTPESDSRVRSSLG